MTPDEHTNQEFFLDVGDDHQLSVMDWGNSKAKVPIIMLHGGPGGGCSDGYKQQFDPTVQRVIFHDQRGSGKSLPHGGLEHNTTDDMIEDIEKLAGHFQLKKFILTGGSWGSCLGLAYAIKHPGRVQAIVFRGIFTGRQSEIDWLAKGDFRTHFPDVWAKYLADTPKSHHHDPSSYHWKQALSNDQEAAKQSAYTYEQMEGALLRLDDRYTAPEFETYNPAAIKVEITYSLHGCYLPEGYILDQAHRLTMPIWMVQGRYDMCCPPRTAYELHQRLPNSHLILTPAGHSSGDRAAYDVSRTILAQLTET